MRKNILLLLIMISLLDRSYSQQNNEVILEDSIVADRYTPKEEEAAKDRILKNIKNAKKSREEAAKKRREEEKQILAAAEKERVRVEKEAAKLKQAELKAEKKALVAAEKERVRVEKEAAKLKQAELEALNELAKNIEAIEREKEREAMLIAYQEKKKIERAEQERMKAVALTAKIKITEEKERLRIAKLEAEDKMRAERLRITEEKERLRIAKLEMRAEKRTERLRIAEEKERLKVAALIEKNKIKAEKLKEKQKTRKEVVTTVNVNHDKSIWLTSEFLEDDTNNNSYNTTIATLGMSSKVKKIKNRDDVFSLYIGSIISEQEFEMNKSERDGTFIGTEYSISKNSVQGKLKFTAGIQDGNDSSITNEPKTTSFSLETKLSKKIYCFEPSLVLGVHKINLDEYKKYNGATIPSESITTFNIHPEIKISKVFQNKIEPYATLGYNYNSKKMDLTKQGVRMTLPTVDMSEYLEGKIGVEIPLKFNEFVLNGEVIYRNGHDDIDTFAGKIGFKFNY